MNVPASGWLGRLRAVALHVVIVGLGLVAVLGFALVLRANDRLTHQLDPLLTLADRTERNLALAHLWFEERIAGDETNSMETVYGHIDSARRDVRNGRSATEDRALEELLVETEDRIVEWRGLTGARLITRSTTGAIGSDADQHYDDLFNRLLAMLDAIRARGEASVDAERATVRHIGYGQLVLTTLVFAALTLMLTKVRRATRSASEAAARGRFLATMSHEIRTPLNAIIGMTEVLGRAPLDTQARQYVDTLSQGATQLMSVVNDVLDFSKMEGGKIDLERAAFELRDVVEGTLDLFARAAAEKRLELLADIAPETPHRVVGDEMRLRQVLSNLIGNAIKFTDRGTVSVVVRAVAHEHVLRLELEVRDTGIGMSRAQIAQLFTPFQQGDASTTRRFGGTGLGLTISRRLVRAMGGDILVESTVGAGSVFAFSLLVERASATARSAEDFDALHGGRYLVVDDNDDNRRVLSLALREVDCESIPASSGPEALSILDTETRFDGILLDIHMPGMDGWEVVQRLIEHPRRSAVPIFVLSSVGDAPPDLREHVAAMITKPVRQRRLWSALMSEVGSPAVQAPSPVGRARLTSGPSYRLLVVDDSRLNREVVRALLADTPHEVTLAASGAEALALVAHETFDFVLMDVEMPELDGIATTAEIRRRLPASAQPVVIAFTANAMSGDRQRCLDAGMDEYLAKPFRLADLEALLARRPRQRPDAPQTTAPVDGDENADVTADAVRVQHLLDSLPVAARGALVSGFLEESRARITHLDHAILRERMADAYNEGHALKGSLALLGATSAADHIEVVASLARQGEGAKLAASWPIAKRHVDALRARVERTLSRAR